MNWRIESVGDKLRTAVVDVTHGADEDTSIAPTDATVDAVRAAANETAKALGPRLADVLVTIDGHETTEGDGFRDGHMSVTVSRLAPGART
jgi:hypothetical protein